MTADAHFRLRIPTDLKRQIEESASANHRSINAEILQRLHESFTDPVVGKGMIDHLSEHMARTIHEKVAARVTSLEEEVSELRKVTDTYAVKLPSRSKEP